VTWFGYGAAGDGRIGISRDQVRRRESGAAQAQGLTLEPETSADRSLLRHSVALSGFPQS